MKVYMVELEDRVAAELEDVAENAARMSAAALIALFVAKAVAPWHRASKKVLDKMEGEV